MIICIKVFKINIVKSVSFLDNDFAMKQILWIGVLLLAKLFTTNAFYVEAQYQHSTMINITPLVSESLMIGGTLKRQCSASTPGWYAVWKDNQGFQVAGDTLVLDNLQPGRYEYTCVLTKSDRQMMKTMTYSVMKHQPISIKMLDLITMCANTGNYTVIVCKQPDPGSNWKMYWVTPCGDRIDGDLLEIDYSKGGYSGIYTCVGESRSGQVNYFVNYELRIRPVLNLGVKVARAFIKKVGREKLSIGGKLHRRCIASFPCVKVSWVDPKGKITFGSELFLSPITTSDLGVYKCQFKLIESGITVSKTIHLNEIGNGKVHVGMPVVTASITLRANLTHGRTLKFGCQSNAGTSNEFVSWTMNSGATVSKGAFELAANQTKNSGSYTCTVRRKGEITGTAVIHVYITDTSKDKPKIFIVTNNNDGLGINGAIERVCQVSQPGWKISWILPHVKRESSDKLSIIKLQLVNQGQYICVAEKHGQTIRTSFTVTLSGTTGQAQMIIDILPGDDLRLTGRLYRRCRSNHTNVKAIWMLPDGSPHSDAYIDISNLQPSNNGRYTCRGISRTTKVVNAWFVVDIESQKETRIFIQLLDKDNIAENGVINRRCMVNVGKWDYSWIFPSGRQFDRQEILVTDLQALNNGMYTCYAIRKSDKITLKVSFRVNLPKPSEERIIIAIKPMHKESERYGGKLSRRCEVNKQGWVAFWIFPNGTRHKSGDLVISDLKSSNNGRYLCIATNEETHATLSTVYEVAINEPKSVLEDVSLTFVNIEVAITNGRLILTCKSNVPGWKLHWLDNKKQRYMESTLSIYYREANIEGLYKCIATNNYKVIMQSVQITMSKKIPDYRYVKIKVHENRVTKVLTFTCEHPKSPDNWYTYWITACNQKVIGQKLKIMSDSFGIYRCVTQSGNTILVNHFDLAPSSTDNSSLFSIAQISIEKIGNDILDVGGIIKRRCQMKSHCPVEISWTDPAGKETKGRDLILDNLNPSQQGLYTCKAIDSRRTRGIVQKSFYLEISYNKVVVQTASIVVRPNSQKPEFGKVTTFVCKPPSSDGSWKVKWKTSDENQVSIHGSNLNLKLQDKYRGEYQCIASNEEVVITTSLNFIPSDNIKGKYTVSINDGATGTTQGQESSSSSTVLQVIVPSKGERVPVNGVLKFSCGDSGRGWTTRLVDSKNRYVDEGEIVLNNRESRQKDNYKCVYEKDNIVVTQTVDTGPSDGKVTIVSSQIQYENKGPNGEVLVCKPPTSGKWKMTWTNPCEKRVTGTIMKINEFSPEGIYYCTAELGNQILNNTFQLKRNNQQGATGSIVKVEIEDVDKENLKIGGRIELRCKVTSLCQMKLKWRTPTKGEIEQSNIVIDKFTQKDEGRYFCIAYTICCGNEIRIKATESIILKMNGSEVTTGSATIIEIVKPSHSLKENITYTCEAPSGSSRWNTYWLNPSKVRINSQQQLSKKTMENMGGGLYTCVAYNQNVSMVSTMTFKVTQSEKGNVAGDSDIKKTITRLPLNTDVVINAIIPSKSTEIGQVMQIRCKSNHAGWSSWWLSKNGTQIMSDTLSFNKIAKKDSGLYKCVSGNENKRIIETVHIGVDGNKVKINSLIIEYQLGGNNKDIILVCESLYTDVAMVVFWITPCGHRINNTKLVIRDQKEEGFYQCYGNSGSVSLKNFVWVDRKHTKSTSANSVLHVKIETIGIDNTKIGGRIQRRCEGQSQCPVSIKWILPNKDEISKSDLILNDLSAENKGLYTCVVYETNNRSGRVVNQTFYLAVKDGEIHAVSPRITRVSTPTISGEGESQYSCDTPDDGDDWNSFWVTPDQKKLYETNLQESKLDAADSGTYTCVATNGDISVADSISVEVSPISEKNTGKLPNKTLTPIYVAQVNVDVSLTGSDESVGGMKLRCDVNQIGWKFKWMDSDKVKINQTQEINVNNLKDGDIMYCEIQGQGKKLIHNVMFVQVNDVLKPMTVTTTYSTIGKNMVLKCVAPKNGWNWKTVWFGPCFRKLSDTDTLRLSEGSQDGIYYCTTAANQIKLTSQLYINRKTKDKVFSTSMSIKFIGKDSAIIGGKLHLRCESTAQCPQKFIWIHPDKSESKGSDLIINNFQKSNVGKYECISAGFLTTTRKSISLSLDKGHITSVSPKITGSIVGIDGKVDGAEYDCEGPDSSWDSKWLDPEDSPIHSSKLNFQSTDPANSGRYTCVLTNGDQTITESIDIAISNIEEVPESHQMLPTNQSPPNVTILFTSISFKKFGSSADLGSTAIFYCNAYPTEYIDKWTNREYRAVSGKVLSSNQGNRASTGICYSKIRNTEIFSNVTFLMVDNILQPAFIKLSYASSSNGNKIILHCNPQSISIKNWKIFWNGPCMRKTSGNTLSLTANSHAGKYTCFAAANGVLLSSQLYLIRGSDDNVYLTKVNILTIGEDNPVLGGKIHRRCIAVADCKVYVMWIRPDGTTINGPDLKIDTIQIKDIGMYKCKASDINGNHASMAFYLNDANEKFITSVPTITGSNKPHIFAGQVIDYLCEAPKGGWKAFWRNPRGAVIKDKRVLITSATAVDSGTYGCYIEKGKMLALATINVQVYEEHLKHEPEEPKPSIHISDVMEITTTTGPTRIGNNMKLSCKMNRKGWTTKWLKKNDVVIKNDRIESKITGKENGGEYVCITSNGNTTISSNVVVVVKQERAYKFFTQIADVSSTRIPKYACYGPKQDNRKWKVYWIDPCNRTASASTFFNDQTIIDGIYKCVAENGNLKVYSQAIFRKGNSNVRLLTADITKLGNENLVLGGEMHRYCSAKSSCPTSGKWIMPNKEEIRKPELNKINLSKNDTGLYVCVVWDTLNQTSSKSFYLSVEGDIITTTDIKVNGGVMSIPEVGDTILFTCNITVPLIRWTLFWLTNTNTISRGAVLEIKHATNKDIGEYTCVAANYRMTLKQSVHVSLNDKSSIDTAISSTTESEITITNIKLTNIDINSLSSGKFKLICGENHPDWNTSWVTIRNQHIKSRELDVSYNKLNQTFDYRCIYSKGSMKMDKTIRIQVVKGQFHMLYSKIDYTTSDKRLVLTCKPPNKGNWIIYWTNPCGFRINGKTIEIENRKPTGVYGCYAESNGKSVVSQVYLGSDKQVKGNAVQMSLEVDIKQGSKDNPILGGRIERRCVAVSNCPVTVSWKLPSKSQIKGSALIVEKISEKNAGTYVCKAVGFGGRKAKKSFHLSISSTGEVTAVSPQISGDEDDGNYACATPDGWDGSWITPSGESLTKSILSEKELDDSGEYVCSMTKDGVVVTDSIFVEDSTIDNNEVHVKPNSQLPKNVTINQIIIGTEKEGDSQNVGSIEVYCKSDPQTLTPRWEPKNERQSNNSYTCAVEVNGVTIKKNIVTFVENSQVKLMDAMISYAASKNGNNIMLQCQPQNNDRSWNIFWYNPCQTETKGGVSHVNTFEYSGVYTCVAKSGKVILTSQIYLKRELSGINVVDTKFLTVGADNPVIGGKIVRHCLPVLECNTKVRWILPNRTKVNGPDLTIKNIQRNDIGVYTCKGVDDIHHTMASKSFYLNVIDGKVKVVAPIISGKQVQGKIIDYTCEVPDDGWQITWLTPVQGIIEGSRIHITDANKSHDGTYTCVISKNNIGISTTIDVVVTSHKGKEKEKGKTTATLKIEYSSVIQTIIITPQNPTPVGNRMVAICKSTIPGIKAMWRSDNRQVLSTQKVGKKDEGKYTCVAKKDGKVVVSQTAVIAIVNNLAQMVYAIVKQDTSVSGKTTYICKLSVEYNTARIYWYDSCKTRIEGNVLRMSEDNIDGIYKCVIEIRGQRVINQFKVQRNLHGNVRVMKTKIQKLGADKLLLGGKINRICVGVANCPTTVKWVNPNKSERKGSELVINGIKEDDKGLYVCKATDTLGQTANSSFYLVIQDGKVKPVTNGIKGGIIPVEGSGDQMAYSCDAPAGDFGWDSYWITPDNERVDKNEIELNNMEESDSGRYTCVSSKDDMVITDSVEVEVSPIEPILSTSTNQSRQLIVVTRIKSTRAYGKSIDLQCNKKYLDWKTSWVTQGNKTVNDRAIFVGGAGKDLMNNTEYKCIYSKGSFTMYQTARILLKPNGDMSSLYSTITYTISDKGQYLTLLCKPPKEGYWITYWTTPCGSEVRSETYTVRINNEKTGGVYRCVARSKEADVISHVYLGSEKELTRSNISFEAFDIKIEVLDPRVAVAGRRLRCSTTASKCDSSIVRWELPDGSMTTGQYIPVTLSGKYTCVALKENKKNIKKSVILKVSDGKIDLVSNNITKNNIFEEAGIADYTCESPEGFESYWITPQDKKLDKKKISVMNSDGMENGVYTCYATNGESVLTDSIDIEVSDIATASISIYDKVNANFIVFDDLTRTCVVNQTGWNIHWITSTGKQVFKKTLMIKYLNVSDSGTYKCVAENPFFGYKLTDQFSINVTLPKSNVVIGIPKSDSISQYEGRCKRLCKKNPLWKTLEFYREIPVSSTSPLISNKIVCVVGYKGSKSIKNRAINVMFVNDTKAPVKIITLQGEQLTYNGSLHRQCKAIKPGESGWTISWVIPGPTVVDSDVLSMKQLTNVNNGKYMCYAIKHNPCTTVSDSFFVNVKKPKGEIQIERTESDSDLYKGKISRKCIWEEGLIGFQYFKGNTDIRKQKITPGSFINLRSGTFTCEMYFSSAYRQTKSAKVFVNEPNALIRIVKEEGDNVKFSGKINRLCQVDSTIANKDSWTLKWIKPGVKIENNYKLLVPKLTMATNGKYMCIGYNRLNGDTVINTFTVDVEEPLPKTFLVQVETKIANGGRIFWKCGFERFLRRYTFLWRLPNGTEIKQIDLKINHLSVKDTGTYECWAIDRKTNTRRGVKVVIKFRLSTSRLNIQGPIHVKDSNNKTIARKYRCVISSVKQGWKTLWKLPNNSTVPGNALVVPEEKVAAGGIYYCIARNGRTKLTATLSVSPLTKVKIALLTKTLKTGSELKMKCMMKNSDNSGWKFSWYFKEGSKMEKLQDGAILTKKELLLSDLNGSFVCIATNRKSGLKAYQKYRFRSS